MRSAREDSIYPRLDSAAIASGNAVVGIVGAHRTQRFVVETHVSARDRHAEVAEGGDLILIQEVVQDRHVLDVHRNQAVAAASVDLTDRRRGGEGDGGCYDHCTHGYSPVILLLAFRI